MRSLDDLDPMLVPLLLGVQKEIKTCKAQRNTDSLELFSGLRAITNSASDMGMIAYGYDKEDGPSLANNILSDQGYKKALKLVCSIKPGGFLWAAPECSSWIWVSRSGSGRSSYLPDGDITIPRIDKANRMVSRVVSLMLLAWSRHVHIFLEQPISSVMNFISPLKEFIASCLLFCTVTYLGAFGAKTMKPLNIWSTAKEVMGLKRPRPKSEKRLVKKKDGRTYGKAKDLHDSSAYPLLFGRAVAEIYVYLAMHEQFSYLFDTDMAELLAEDLEKPKQEKPKKKTVAKKRKSRN